MFNIAEFINKHKIKGFLADDEGQALYDFALRAKNIGPCLEIGSYCGKSAVYLGSACKVSDNVLFSIDHHRGSEEQQPGEEYFDAELFDEQAHQINTFPALQASLKVAGLESSVVPIVSRSQLVCRFWQTPLGMVFIDGGHSPEEAMRDCVSWGRQLARGGFLAVHDIFSKPEMGGQGPYLAVKQVMSSGEFEQLASVNSLVVLEKKSGIS